MLVVTRKRNQVVRIGDDIEVMVVRLVRGGVRLGIKAPDGVLILRKEVAERIAEQEPKGGAS